GVNTKSVPGMGASVDASAVQPSSSASHFGGGGGSGAGAGDGWGAVSGGGGSPQPQSAMATTAAATVRCTIMGNRVLTHTLGCSQQAPATPTPTGTRE